MLARPFTEHGVIALGWKDVGIGDLERYDAYELVRRLEAVGMPAPDADAEELISFRDHLSGGDVVVTPTDDGDVLVGRVTGAYQYLDDTPVADHHHTRSVRWLGRWTRDALPDHLRTELRARRTLKRLSVTGGWTGIAERLEAGERPPARTRTSGTRAASTPRRPSATAATRAAAAAKKANAAAVARDQVCASCGLRLRSTQFDAGSDTCRDCS